MKINRGSIAIKSTELRNFKGEKRSTLNVFLNNSKEGVRAIDFNFNRTLETMVRSDCASDFVVMSVPFFY
jgi:hypothetical protein